MQNVVLPADLDARKSGSFKIGGEIEIHRLGFGAMRVTGPGIWGPPVDKAEAIRSQSSACSLLHGHAAHARRQDRQAPRHHQH